MTTATMRKGDWGADKEGGGVWVSARERRERG
jgi:hypothetical protein